MLPFLQIGLKLVKFPALNKWIGGTVLFDINITMCDGSRSQKRRKSNIYLDALQQIWLKYGNYSLDCPVEHVSFIYVDLF